MKLLILTAVLAIVAASPVLEKDQVWPWQVGKEYRYEVDSYTWTKFEKSVNNGNAFKTQFVIRVDSPGVLIGKLEFTKYAQVTDVENGVPDVDYKPVENMDQPFEIIYDEGRIVSMNVHSSLSVAHENMVKALVSGLQVDLSSHGYVHDYPNYFDKEAFQGVFKKMEADVTGDCETLYSVAPSPAEWRRELPLFTDNEDPVVVTKVRNYESCQKRASYNFGVPEGYLWQGVATANDEKQFIKHTSETRALVGKQGTIYKSEVTSSVSVNPLMFGKQKAEVKTFTRFYLISDVSNNAVWKKPEDLRPLHSLLFTLSESIFFTASDKHVANAQKLLQEMTPLLANPGNLPKSDFLSKFNVLVNIIASMTPKQLSLLSSSMDIARNSTNVEKNNMWIVYRDAVAQAGTVEAFMEIKSWVMAKHIQGEEAGQVLNTLAAGFWEADITPDFFYLALSKEVMEQKNLNTSALLAASKVIRNSKYNEFIVNDAIPRIAKELKEALEKGDNTKANVYIRVLGNMAHPEILSVYAPYLEGKVPVSQYLRRQMVSSLKNLANAKNEYVRAVLFSILINTAEPYEIRVAAALNIFLSFPTSEMFQVFAEMTNTDPSTQVQAVLANGIMFASKLNDPRFAELARNAKSVLETMNKNKFGYRYSTDSIVDDVNGGFLRELAFIGSEDNLLPKYQRSSLTSRTTAWSEESEVTMSFSNMQQFMNYINEYTQMHKKSDTEFKFDAKKIAELLNLKRKTLDPFEGELFIEDWNQQMLFNFNEEDLKGFFDANDLENCIKKLMVEGTNYNYTKVLNKKEVSIVFPLATGMPFIYEYNEPTLVIIKGFTKLNLQAGKVEKRAVENELEITYSRNLDGSVGFMDTLGNKAITTGIINKFQIYAPLILNFDFNWPPQYKLKIGLLRPNQDANMVHLSVSPYSTVQDRDSVLAILEDPATKLIERPNKVISMDQKIGHFTGMHYNFQGFSYSNDYKNFDKLITGDLLADFGALLYQKDVALTLFNFKYLGESPNNYVTLDLLYDTLFNQNVEGEMEPAAYINDVAPYSVTRRQEIVKRAARGIKSAEVKVYDLSAVFEGKENIDFMFTVAFAESHIDSKFQAAYFIHAKEQMNLVAQIIKPEIFPLNFEQALNSDMKVSYMFDFKYGNSSNIVVNGYGERSEWYSKQLLNDPMGQNCMLQAGQKNVYLMDCYKMIMKAHAPDFFKATIQYKEDVNPMVYSYLYGIFRDVFSVEEEFTPDTSTPAGTVEMQVHAHYYDNYVNYQFKTHYGIFELNNVEGMSYYPYFMSIYPLLNKWERTRNYFTGYQNLPVCTIDDNMIRTFSGRTYDYSLSSSWHVVMHDQAEGIGHSTDLVVLARRPSDNQEEVYVSYRPNNGMDLELEISPSAVKVTTNATKSIEGPFTMYWDDLMTKPQLQYYDLAKDVKVFHLAGGEFRIVYDKQRLIIFTDSHRASTHGVCGQSTGQEQDDYMTPWGIVDLPQHYGAAFSLEGEASDSAAAEWRQEAKQKAYQPVTKYTSIMSFDPENKTL